MNLEKKINLIKHNLTIEGYTIAAKECVFIIEHSFREIFTRHLTKLEEKDRIKVQNAEYKIGKGIKGVESFTMGQLVGVFRESKFIDAWSRSSDRELSSIRMINMDELTSLRNELVHKGREASSSEAHFLFNCLKLILETFGILSIENIENTNNKQKNIYEKSQNNVSIETKENTADITDKNPKRKYFSIVKNLIDSLIYYLLITIIIVFLIVYFPKKDLFNFFSSPKELIVFQDNFDDNSKNWVEGKFQTSDSEGERKIIDGKYQRKIEFIRNSSVWQEVPNFSAKNFILTIDAKIVKEYSDDNILIVIAFRKDKNGNFYEIRLGNEGSYKIGLWHNDNYRVLQRISSSDSFNFGYGKYHKISIKTYESCFNFHVNGKHLSTVKDSTLKNSGKLGFGVSGEKGRKALVEFDNLVIVENYNLIKTSKPKKDFSQNYEVKKLFEQGIDYYEGRGVNQNYEKALKLYHMAAEKGHSGAQTNLGFMFFKGYGVEKNFEEALKWYRKAAKKGNITAQNNLGNMYFFGNGVDVNNKEAMKWYMRAAEKGYDRAQFNIGRMLKEGYGVEQNFEEAKKWFDKSYRQGNEDAGKELKEIDKLINNKNL